MSNAPGKSEIFSERVVGRNAIGKTRMIIFNTLVESACSISVSWCQFHSSRHEAAALTSAGSA